MNNPESRLKEFIRAHQAGGCRILSEGRACTCPLCDADKLTELSRALEGVMAFMSLPPSYWNDEWADSTTKRYKDAQERLRKAREACGEEMKNDRPETNSKRAILGSVLEAD